MNNRQFLSLSQIRHIEAEAINNHHLDLMDMAGDKIAKWVSSNFTKQQKILVLVGRGNNGGDGVIAAIKLKENNFNVSICTVASQLNPTTENLIAQFKQQNGKQLSRIPRNLGTYELIIDAILGIGINNNLDDKLVNLIEAVNYSKSFVLAVDTPTGLNPFNAEIYGAVVRANHTITFICDKPGFHTGSGIDLVGTVTIEPLIDSNDYDLGQADALNIIPNELSLLNYQVLTRKLRNTNKGSFGTVAIVGGNRGMHGALYLAGRSAMLLGSGKVVLASLDPLFTTDYFMPELMLTRPKDLLRHLDKYNVIVVGPGLGKDEKAIEFLTKLFKQKSQNKFIFDADALNLVAANSELKTAFRAINHKIITPHPGEAARMLGITINEVECNRFIAVDNLQTQYNAVTLLKGTGSLIQDMGQVYLNFTGNAALSNSGQGDILCGITAAFIAQGMNMLDALRFAVYLHGKAAEYLINTLGLNGVLASEVAHTSRQLLNELLYSKKILDT